jgi:hypothetical protein
MCGSDATCLVAGGSSLASSSTFICGELVRMQHLTLKVLSVKLYAGVIKIVSELI